MNIDVIISAEDIRPELITNKVVVVIDMLRATSVITTALANGAEKVIPVLTVEESFKIAESLNNEVILGGERRAVKIDGFHMSNSPLEYTRKEVEGRTVILSTTNGTKAINNCLEADKIYIGCMLNAKAVADKLIELDKDVVFVNAGTLGKFSIDDFICAGYMIKCLSKNSNAVISDLAFTAKYVYDNNNNVLDYIKNARHYEVLKSLNLEADIQYCVKKDLFSIVPEYKQGEITI
ncbi:2-phosphosulfolactate phosphatase family protein [Clostridium manihotivorum]|uniref:Probable 2-phosphosulfolactate phosphatase n=1 Tax=Clostridium manihotivorum TaxID=2320868 RepID=A0A3R5U3H4_9CLOT|nr:2-phosphosulfolactate phosphatase family protein [Clostridium manihotivorum]QAA30645.1 2-phosphosulfolactate phosphatase family protein [Clostridium manihotivorum]